MALNYVALTADLYDGQGNPVVAGTATFTPSATLTDSGDHEIITQSPVTVAFNAANSPPVVSLLATDNAGPQPAGWTWAVTFTNVPGSPAGFSFFLAYATSAAQRLSALAPVVSGTSFRQPMLSQAATAAGGYALVNGTGTILSWAVPNDGALHRATLIAGLHVTSTETGGAITLNTNLPDGTAASPVLFTGGTASGVVAASTDRIVEAGSTVTLTQSSALTGGAAVLWAQLWGA